MTCVRVKNDSLLMTLNCEIYRGLVSRKFLFNQTVLDNKNKNSTMDNVSL